MDLTGWLLRHAPPRPLVITTPGGTAARITTERLLRERGWREAASPAEANILVVAGPVGSEVRRFVDAVWGLIPAPRARADAGSPEAAATALDAAAAAVRDTDQQRLQAAEPARADHGQDQQQEHGDGEQSQHEHAHHGHDMGGMDMPGNVPMADRADDRDGLVLDQLHVPLGPFLPDWPAGLVVRTTLQGDIIQDATVETVGLGDAGREPFWQSSERLVARRLDSCARLLSVAGWTDAAVMARRLRDDTVGGERRVHTAESLARWARRVRRSRTLRWSLAGVGATADGSTAPAELRGDALGRLHRWLDLILQAFDQPGSRLPRVDGPADTRWAVDALPALLAGTELANARLLVASLDPDLEQLVPHEVHHG